MLHLCIQYRYLPLEGVKSQVKWVFQCFFSSGLCITLHYSSTSEHHNVCRGLTFSPVWYHCLSVILKLMSCFQKVYHCLTLNIANIEHFPSLGPVVWFVYLKAVVWLGTCYGQYYVPWLADVMWGSLVKSLMFSHLSVCLKLKGRTESFRCWLILLNLHYLLISDFCYATEIPVNSELPYAHSMLK